MVLYCEVCGYQDKKPKTPIEDEIECPNGCGYLECVSNAEVKELEKNRKSEDDD